MKAAPLRLCEYQSCRVDWSQETREEIVSVAEAWRTAHRLPQPPVSFEGAEGNILRAAQYVGVIEAGGACVEIYPKLDASLEDSESPDSAQRSTVMANLLWLLEQSGFGGLIDAGDADVKDSPETISDLLAWLFALRLCTQLTNGLPMEYLSRRDDIPFVRGSIDFARQATALFGRPDIIACAWDEFTSDTPLTRLLRCAGEMLLAQARLPSASAALRDALEFLTDVPTPHPLEAIAGSRSIRWSRLNMRWRTCHDIALTALQGFGRDLNTGGSESFVFLLDMNQLFESFCTRWLRDRTGTSIREQARLGHLLAGPTQKLLQIPDFMWDLPDEIWVGDAKYKRATDDNWPKIDDVRQLICYGQLARRDKPLKQSRLMLLYPTTGPELAQEWQTFDGQLIRMQSVRIIKACPESQALKA